MQRDVYVTHQLRAMTKSVIDDALLQAVSHIKHADSVLWRYEILSGILPATF